MTLLDYPIGSKVNLPEYIVKSKSIISLDNVENNMCFWACLALIKGARKSGYTKLMKQLFSENYNCYNNNYSKFDYANELNDVEKRTNFAINIVNFKENGEIQYIRKSDYNDTKTLQYLNLYHHYFSYITNFEKLGIIFTCSKCGYKASYPGRINMHTCIKETVDYFENYSTLWEKSRNTVVEPYDYY